MSDQRVEVVLLKMKIEELTLRTKFLQEKNCELQKQLQNCEEFQQKLITYLLEGAKQQDQLQKELDELKLLCLQTDLQKRE
jgi:hypothetical protein